MAREYLIDGKLFYGKVAEMPPEERGPYLLKIAIGMNTDNINENWIREKPKPRGRQKKVKKAYNQGYTAEFETFWKEYPKKESKGTAFAVWQDLEDDKETLLSSCLRSLSWQKESDKWKSGYIPKGENYLSGRCWEDENPNQGKVKERYLDMNGIWKER